MKRWSKVLLGFGLIALLLAAPILILRREEPQVQARLVALADGTPDDEAAGYSRVFEPKDLDFPAEHGPHPDYQTEWWYYTGNLVAEGGQRFGYQLTFFRRALAPPDLRLERESAWAVDQVYMAHFALTDISGERFHATERFARGAAGLALSLIHISEPTRLKTRSRMPSSA